MEIADSSLWREVEAIITSARPVNYTWSAEIHVGDRTFPVLKILDLDFNDNFEQNYCSVVMGKMAILGGIYVRQIYPFKDNLEMSLYRVPLYEATDENNPDTKIYAERFRMILKDTGNPVIENNMPNETTEDILNLTNIFEVEFQLINKSIEQLRLLFVGGIYRKVTVEDLIKSILTNESKRLKDIDNVYVPEGVDMVPASNKKIREHVVIPQGTKLVDIPNFIHNKAGGVYGAGLGYYLYNGMWYVYPCYDNTRFDQVENSLTIINIPPNKLPNIERTYRRDGGNLVILATSNVKFRSNSEVQQLNQGNGIRFADANNFMDGFSKTGGNKVSVSRGSNNSEFMSKPDSAGKNNAPVSSNAINANPYLEMSKLAKRNGNMITLVWENSNPNLLFPGMMVRVLYQAGPDIQMLQGTLLQAHSHIELRGKGYTEIRYRTNTALVLFTNEADLAALAATTNEEDAAASSTTG